MTFYTALFICLGASSGALLRWGFGLVLNAVFPTIPLGTLAANLLGGFLMGICMELIKNYPFVPEMLRLAITTGFLGGLTTFSTFSAETISLLAHQEYFWFCSIIVFHVAGSLLATILGIYTWKFVIS